MLLRSKEIAYVGICIAVAVLLLVLGGYWEGSTLFLLAAASFLAGMIEKNFSVVAAFAFVAGTVILGLLLAPQKLYCATFAAFAVYVVTAEYFEEKQMRPAVVWSVKAVLYHLFLLGFVLGAQMLFGWELFLQAGLLKKASGYPVLFAVLLFVCAEAFWLIFDRAYVYFCRRYGHYFRGEE